MEKINFEVGAKAARLIGRENIADVDGALIELIKNAYDADASCVCVWFDMPFPYVPTDMPAQKIHQLLCEEDRKQVLKYYVESENGDFHKKEDLAEEENNELKSILAKYNCLIVADNGKQLLILVNKSVTDHAQHIIVEFSDHTAAEAVLCKYDSNTGLAVIGVNLEDISEETLDHIEMAKLGSSKSTNIVGRPVIAIGSPLGTQDSVAYGLITSVSDKRQMTDTDINLITTDIYGSKSGTGVLINLKGEVLGVITQNYHNSDRENLLSAFSISDLKESIAKLSNGQDRALLGILGTDVTEVAREELGIPEGAYVTEIVMDSPAMETGIQSGDVITKFGTGDITCFDDFKAAMDKSQPGDNTVITVMRFAMGEYTEMNFETTLGTLE